MLWTLVDQNVGPTRVSKWEMLFQLEVKFASVLVQNI